MIIIICEVSFTVLLLFFVNLKICRDLKVLDLTNFEESYTQYELEEYLSDLQLDGYKNRMFHCINKATIIAAHPNFKLVRDSCASIING